MFSENSVDSGAAMIPEKVRRFGQNFWVVRNIFIIIITFIIPINLATADSIESKCAYGLLVMSILWLTEAFPIPVTALLPAVIFPMLGVVETKEVCSKFINHTSLLFLGGLIVAVAEEEVGLHTRIAMAIISVLGSNPNMLMLGLMLPTWFLSMWISNTAATSMMIPIIQAVMDQVREAERIKRGSRNEVVTETSGLDDPSVKTSNSSASMITALKLKNGGYPDDVELASCDDSTSSSEDDRDSPELVRLGKGLALSVAYSANAGGIATLTGTPPNLILQGIANGIYEQVSPGADSGITFANWMGFAFPLSVLILILCWMWLQLVFLRSLCIRKSDPVKKKAIEEAIRKERRKIGKIKFGEIVVLICFVILAVLWIFRYIPGFGGWAYLFKLNSSGKPYTEDSTAAILMAVILFILPKNIPKVFCLLPHGEKKPKYEPILTWEKTVHKVPWGVIVLLGGGFALADVCKVSGLSKMVGCSLRVFSYMNVWVMNLIICLIVAGATEVTSNSATATLLMPIMAELAVTLGENPLYLMISTAVACSFAFMLPVATPPNAIVFSTGILKIPDMATTGLMMNVVAIFALTLAINTWAVPIFSLDVMPEIFNSTSVKSSCS